MADETSAASKNTFEFKDVLFAVPVIGTSFALSFEAGSFVPMGEGAFSLFSITEHIGFALANLPIAIFLGCISVPYAMSFHRSSEPAIRHFKSGRYFMIAVPLFIVAAILGVIGYRQELILWMATAFALMSAAFTFAMAPQSVLSKPTIPIVWGLSTALLLTFALGADATRMTLNSGLADATLTFDDGLHEVIFLRSGDRGALFYEPSLQRFGFRRWEAVKKLDWKRTSLRKRFNDGVSRAPFPLPF